MEVLGLAFVGSRTRSRAAMAAFVRDVLGIPVVSSAGMDADVFALPDGSALAVAPVDDDEAPERTVGFRVADIDAAAAELRAAGVEVDDEISSSDRQRYVHFRAPDGRLYELVEDLTT